MAVGRVVAVEDGMVVVEEVDGGPAKAYVAGVLGRLALCVIPCADTVLGERRGGEQYEGEEQGEVQELVRDSGGEHSGLDVQKRLGRELFCAICRVSDDGEGRGQEEFDR